jgi:methionyl-tRNA synthetase
MAKDNVPFHSIIFPSCLLGTGENYTKVKHMSGIDYLNYEDGKFSKSRGIGVFGDQAKLTQLDSDIFRFYLAYIRPETQDSSFSWDDLLQKNNSELLNNLGNFINRALAFCDKNMNGTVPKIELTSEDGKVLAKINLELKEYDDNLSKLRIRDAIKNILNISRVGNQYMQAKKPWVLIKSSLVEEQKSGESVIGVCVNIAYLISVLIYPYMPNTAATIRRQLNVQSWQYNNDTTSKEVDLSKNIRSSVYSYPKFYHNFQQFISGGHKIGKIEPLFKRITDDDVKVWKEKFSGQQQPPPSNEQQKPTETKKVVSKSGTEILQLKIESSDKLISKLRQKIDLIKMSNTPEFIAKMKSEISKENDALKRKVEQLKIELDKTSKIESKFILN